MSAATLTSRALLYIALLATITTAIFPIDPNAAAKDLAAGDEYRLPTALTPEHYKLEVITHLGDADGFKFNVNVRIKVSASTIELNNHRGKDNLFWFWVG